MMEKDLFQILKVTQEWWTPTTPTPLSSLLALPNYGNDIGVVGVRSLWFVFLPMGHPGHSYVEKLTDVAT